MQRLGVGYRLGGRAHFRFRHNFQKRRARTIEVNTGLAMKVFMQGLARVFFQMRAREVHKLLACRLTSAEFY